MQVLSIQSSVAYGHAGNSSAVFPLQRLGVDTWPVNTVAFSNHSGYGVWRGTVFEASQVADVITGVAERGVFPSLDAVLSGYQGAPEIAEVILDAVAQVKAASPRAVYCADPVIGDRGRGVYVRPGIAELMRDRIVPAADITTPNQFELELLTGAEVGSLDALLAAVDALRARGPRIVLVTSVEVFDPSEKTISMVAVDDTGAYVVTTPKLEMNVVAGSGDATTSMFLGRLLQSEMDVPDALGTVASSIFGILEHTRRTGAREMEVVAAQDVIADPPMEFAVERLR
ncbi:pyridoxal kinase PdxY [Mumia sp. zg.B53]|uniref:pyridoxal kinase PdxY n=2 Tax=unclassified Mumia TaxID=2621872 RepID=UPI001C6E1C46|nr:pyridoxal kinase PdxY [Mumia sp. zg.B53]MBW9216624.1 pyridoxal kinase PdxY [Mumia sp. zg.B53]